MDYNSFSSYSPSSQRNVGQCVVVKNFLNSIGLFLTLFCSSSSSNSSVLAKSIVFFNFREPGLKVEIRYLIHLNCVAICVRSFVSSSTLFVYVCEYLCEIIGPTGTKHR